MRFVIDAGEMLKIKMGVNLGRADVGMAEQFLHAAEVTAGLQHMAGKGMAQHVGMHILAHASFAAQQP